MTKLEPYHKNLSYSYALGVFPAMLLIEARPEKALRLLLHPDALESEGVAKLRARCEALGVREEMAERVLRRESKKDNCFAALVFEKYEAKLRPDASHVVLCQVSDGGNLGTALRTCLGLNFSDVAVIRPCVDAFDPHVLRASMGAFYRMNVVLFDDFDQYRRAYPAHTLYPFMSDASIPVDEAAMAAKAPFSLVFGNEQTGLPEHFSRLGTSVRIPQSDAIDSYNLAVSVAIGAYQFRNRNLPR